MEQITENIYRIGVPLRGNPLKEVNSYFVRGKERDLLIDTGFRREECIDVLTEGLKEIGYDPGRLDLFLTHLHSDHTGMAAVIAGKNSQIYMNAADIKLMAQVLDGTNKRQMARRFVSEGMPADMTERIQTSNPARLAALESMDRRFTPVADGAVIDTGACRLEALSMPGHSPGQMMLWMESEGIMFTGDHVLFDITPNITAYAEVGDSLGDYIKSLRKAYAYPVKLALPGHRKPGDYHRRIEALLLHHEKRLAQAAEIVEKYPGLTAYEITGHMTWKIHAKGEKGPAAWDEFPETQRWYAMGECMSHLDHLRVQGKIWRAELDGVYRYYIS